MLTEGGSTADCMWTDKLKSSLEKLNFWFSLPVSSQLILKYAYARRFDTSHDIFWLHFVNSLKLWENKMCQWNAFKFSAIKLSSHSFAIWLEIRSYYNEITYTPRSTHIPAIFLFIRLVNLSYCGSDVMASKIGNCNSVQSLCWKTLSI